MKQYYIYIMTNKYNHVLYTGITNNLKMRVYEHKSRSSKGFTSAYNVDKLVYFEISENVKAAILREKNIKGGSRQKKIQLIVRNNPGWKDLYHKI
jgi:putative endonuclease